MTSSSRVGSGRAGLFVARVEELAELRGLVEQVERGLGRLAVVEGEAGIGKTRLVDEALALARARGWHVARGGGEELARERPFGVVADALAVSRRSPDGERARIAELLVGSPASVSAAPLLDLRFHLVESICDLVEREAARRPVLLVAEDVHWADASSLLTLHRLCGRVRPLQALVVLTARPLPRAPELAQLLEAFERAGASCLRLSPLSDEAVVQLGEHALGHPIGPLLREELARAAGNPLFALELVETLKREHSIERRGGVAELGRRVEPAPSLRLTILRRISFLPAETLQLPHTSWRRRRATRLASRFRLSQQEIPALMGADEGSRLREEIRVLHELMERALEHGHDEVMLEAFRSAIRERQERLARVPAFEQADTPG